MTIGWFFIKINNFISKVDSLEMEIIPMLGLIKNDIKITVITLDILSKKHFEILIK